MVYIAAGASARWRPWPKLELGFEVMARHYSNGRLGLPNKGLNIIGAGVTARYYFSAPEEDYPKTTRPKFEDKGFYYHIALGGGIHSSYPEWQVYTANQPDPALKKIDFKKYPKFSLSADIMYRYARKFGTGIAVDLFYSSNINTIKECDAIMYAGMPELTKAKYHPFSAGIAINQEIYYKNASMFVALGYYPYREMGISDNISRWYQRGGFRYYIPKAHDMFVGISIKAHKLSIAEYLELTVGIRL